MEAVFNNICNALLFSIYGLKSSPAVVLLGGSVVALNLRIGLSWAPVCWIDEYAFSVLVSSDPSQGEKGAAAYCFYECSSAWLCLRVMPPWTMAQPGLELGHS
jgi:hypothetical protein